MAMKSRYGVWAARALLAALTAGVAPVAMAITVALLPAVQVQMGDGSVMPVALEIRDNPRIPGAYDFVGELVTGDGSVRVAGTSKADPFIAWSLDITDFGAPTGFMVMFGSPTLGGPYDTATNELTGQVRAAVSDLMLTAAVGPDFANLADIAGLTIMPASCDTSGCGPFGPLTETGSFASDVMATTITFTGAGDDTESLFDGRFELLNAGAVPEPTALVLAAAGLALLRGCRRRRPSEGAIGS